MTIKILTRFHFHGRNLGPNAECESDSSLRGRAYLFDVHYSYQLADLVADAYYYLDKLVDSDEFKDISDSSVLFTHATMKPSPNHNWDINFYTFDFGDRHNYDWKSSPKIGCLVTSKGIFVGQKGLRDIASNEDLTIVTGESTYRKSTLDLKEYLTNPPSLPDLTYRIWDMSEHPSRLLVHLDRKKFRGLPY